MSVCLHFSYGRPNERRGRINKSWLRPFGSPLRFMTAAAATAAASYIFPPVQSLTPPRCRPHHSPSAHLAAANSYCASASRWALGRSADGDTDGDGSPLQRGDALIGEAAGGASQSGRMQFTGRMLCGSFLSGCDLNVSDDQWGESGRWEQWQVK